MAAGEERRCEITDLLGSHISVIQTDAGLHAGLPNLSQAEH